MKSNFLIGILLTCCFLSCKEKPNKVPLKQVYPYNKTFNKGGYLTYDKKTDIILQKFHFEDSNLSKIHFLNLKNDSVVINSKQIKALPIFIKDLLFNRDSLIILNTMPRTLGKNLKSTDILTKYDRDLNVVFEKDMDISKYPSGDCLIVGDDNNKIFYITDGFEFKQNPQLVVSEIDYSFNILNQKVIERTENIFRCDPIKSIYIEGLGLAVVSKLTYNNRNKPSTFKIEMFDLALNLKWSQDLNANSIIDLGYSDSESKIFLVTEKDGGKINFWDFEGNKEIEGYNAITELLSVASNDNSIFVLEKNPEKEFVTKIDFSGKTIGKAQILKKRQTETTIGSKLIYRQNQLFLIDINNRQNLLTISKIEDKF